MKPDVLGISADQMTQQARNFLESSLGAYILERTEQDIEIARDKLETVVPWGIQGRRQWKQAKMQLEVARRVQAYFGEVLLDSADYDNIA